MNCLVFVLFLGTAAASMAQPALPADPAAEETIDGIVNEFLRLLSNKPGENLEAVRNLFLPSARFTIRNHDEPDFPPVETVGLEEFLELLRDPYYEEDFSESELHQVVDAYNGIAQVFQTFEVTDADAYQGRGITSYQLVHFEERWWIVNVLWTSDSNGVAIPEKYSGK